MSYQVLLGAVTLQRAAQYTMALQAGAASPGARLAALLRNGHGVTTPDLAEVAPGGALDPTAYARLYTRRLGPVFAAIQARATDDGVKAAATSSVLAFTGVKGRYDPKRAMYLPPAGFDTWRQCVQLAGLQLDLGTPFIQR